MSKKSNVSDSDSSSSSESSLVTESSSSSSSSDSSSVDGTGSPPVKNCPKIDKCQIKKCYKNKNVQDAINRVTLYLTGKFAELVAITDPSTIIVVPGDSNKLLFYAGVYVGPDQPNPSETPGLLQLLESYATIATSVGSGQITDVLVNCGYNQVAVFATNTVIFNCPSSPTTTPATTFSVLFILYYNSKGVVQKMEIISQNDVLIPFLSLCQS